MLAILFVCGRRSCPAEEETIRTTLEETKERLAIETADTFMRENPTHPRVDYALYIKGLSYFSDEPYVETSGLDYYEGEKYDAKPAYSFQHTLSQIMMAAINRLAATAFLANQSINA